MYVQNGMGNNFYPKSPYSSPRDEVRMRVWDGMKERGLKNDNKHIEQVRHELDILGKVGYFDYFLIVSDMLRYCDNNGIRTGVGRGVWLVVTSPILWVSRKLTQLGTALSLNDLPIPKE